MGAYHVERLGLRDDCGVVAVYDNDPAARARRPSSPAQPHSTWDSFLRDPQIEVVLIATPPETHFQLAHEALAARRHVVVETPLCLESRDADQLINAACASGRLLSVAHTARWDDEFRTAQAARASGELGNLVALKRMTWQYNPRDLTTDCSGAGVAAEQGPRRAVWRDSKQTGGGTLWEFGLHFVDQLLQLVGHAPQSVFARLIPAAINPQADDAFLLIVTFDGGITAHLEFNRQAAAPLNTGWLISGTQGAYHGFNQFSPTDAGEVVDLPLPPLPTDRDEYYAAIVRHLRHNGPNPVAAEDARAAIAVINAAAISAREGRPIEVGSRQ
jgi:scyllo-inositol 2-dehydrogenase (NADP+)